MAKGLPQPSVLPGRTVHRIKMLAGVPIGPTDVPEADLAAVSSATVVASKPIPHKAALGARSGAKSGATLTTTTLAASTLA